MEKRLTLCAAFLLIVQIWTVNSEDNASSGNLIEFKLKKNDDMIAYQKAQLENKSKLLDIQIDETSKVKQEASDYKLQIDSKERELKNLQTTLNNYNATISKLESENEQTNTFKDELITRVKKQYDEVKELESEIYQIQLNYSSLSDESFKKYQRDQKSLLESCQMDLESQHNEKIDILYSQVDCERNLRDKQYLNTEISTLKKELDDCQYANGMIRYEQKTTRLTLTEVTSEWEKCGSSLTEITNTLNCLQDSSKCITN